MAYSWPLPGHKMIRDGWARMPTIVLGVVVIPPECVVHFTIVNQIGGKCASNDIIRLVVWFCVPRQVNLVQETVVIWERATWIGGDQWCLRYYRISDKWICRNVGRQLDEGRARESIRSTKDERRGRETVSIVSLSSNPPSSIINVCPVGLITWKASWMYAVVASWYSLPRASPSVAGTNGRNHPPQHLVRSTWTDQRPPCTALVLSLMWSVQP